VQSLRSFNVFALSIFMLAVSRCRQNIEIQASTETSIASSKAASWLSTYALHTTVNICLFPPLFFFSGLYYTDVCSAASVLLVYCALLERRGVSQDLKSGAVVLGCGFAALFMRQTNIFWVSIFMAGVEWTKYCKSECRVARIPAAFARDKSTTPSQHVSWRSSFSKHVAIMLQNSKNKVIEDHLLRQAGLYGNVDMWIVHKEGSLIPLGIGMNFASIALTVFFNLGNFLQQTWPYISLGFAFTGFVLWNGGVVLGDPTLEPSTKSKC
jgi:alpha-1,2-glucosyltransferase